MRILWTSVTGNTRALADNLQRYAQEQGHILTLVEVNDAQMPDGESEPFVAIVPTYLEGGTGIDETVKEVMTNALGEYIADHQQWLLGVIGTGNQNFNVQYVLTAKRYAQMFQVPLLYEVEMRGTQQDVVAIYQQLVKVFQTGDIN
jgi:protein involved in ribonucleotide reduction